MYINVFLEKPEQEFGPSYLHYWDDVEGYQKIQYKKYAYKLDPKGIFRTLYGQPAKKVYRWTKEDADNGLIFEGDAQPETRFIIDKYLNLDNPSPNHVEMYFDIEVETSTGLPDIEEANNPITAISYYDKTSKIYVALILDPSGEIIDSKSNKDGEEIEVYSFLNETQLLERFMENYKTIDPTILSGWNIDKFDIPYLYHRLRRLFGEPYANELSKIGLVSFSQFRQRYLLAGVACLDYMQVYRIFSMGERVSYSLDAIGKIEVGMGKIKYEGTLDKLFKEDKEKFIEYNIHDVRIVVKIDEKLKFIDLAKGVIHKGHCQLEDAYYPSRYLDGAILTYMKRKNLVAPNKPKNEHGWRNRDTEDDDEDEDGFEGAYVKEPIPGKYPWVVDLDATSLYPSVIMSLNISPETKVARVANWNAHDFINKKDSLYEFTVNDKKYSLSTERMREFLDTTKLKIASNGVLYDKTTEGIIPEILNKWFDERVEYKNLMKKFGKEKNEEKYQYYYMRQYIQKVILNSLYGVLGLPSFRFYDIDNAEAVTLTGQELIKFAQTIINHYYFEKLNVENDYVIYVDTDSCFFSVLPLVKEMYPDMDYNNTEEMIKVILVITKEIQKYVNSAMNYFSETFLNLDTHRFDMKQELIAKSAFWTRKKRYALNIVNKEGIPTDELMVKGLDTVRTSFPMVFREFMTQMLKDILADVNKEVIDNNILTLKDNIRTFEISKLARPTGIKNITKYYDSDDEAFAKKTKGSTAHAKASINYNDLLKHFNLMNNYAPISNGEKIKWVYLKENPLRLEALAFRDNGEDPPEILDYVKTYIDYEKIFEFELVKKLENFYKSLSWGVIPTKINRNSAKFF